MTETPPWSMPPWMPSAAAGGLGVLGMLMASGILGKKGTTMTKEEREHLCAYKLIMSLAQRAEQADADAAFARADAAKMLAQRDEFAATNVRLEGQVKEINAVALQLEANLKASVEAYDARGRQIDSLQVEVEELRRELTIRRKRGRKARR